MNLFEKHKNCTGIPIGLHMFADDIAELVMPNKYKISINDDIYKFADYLVYEINKDAKKIFDNMEKYKFCEKQDFSRVWENHKRGFFNNIGAEGLLRYTIIYCIAYSIKNTYDDFDMFIHEIVRMSFCLYKKLIDREKIIKES